MNNLNWDHDSEIRKGKDDGSNELKRDEYYEVSISVIVDGIKTVKETCFEKAMYKDEEVSEIVSEAAYVLTHKAIKGEGENTKYEGFEEFLQDKHAEDYIGTDDDMPDDFEAWICDMQADDLIKMGEEYGKKLSINK